MITEALKTDIEQFAKVLLTQHDLLRRAREGRVELSVVERYLASVHFMLRQTPIHLALARSVATSRGHGALAAYFEQKAAEETGHEEWAAQDRQRVSRISGGEATYEPAISVVRMMENTRKAIERDPFLYLAYILFAEYFTVLVGPAWLSALEQHCGVPRSAMTAVDHHVELDRHHVAEGCQEIDRLVTDKRLHGSMREVLRQSMNWFEAFCDELCAASAAAA